MSIRTPEQFIGKVDEQLIWRRKELTDLRVLVERSRDNTSQQSMLIRAGVALLYAHWEGFIKTTGTYFLQFVSAQRLTHAQLKPNFVSIILRVRLNVANSSKKVSTTGDVINFFCTKMESRANVPTKNVIDTESNLSSSVFNEILWMLGLDETPYSTRKIIIDNRLVSSRNCIAHGEALRIKVDDYLALHDDVMALLEEFRNQIQNSCVEKKFMR